MIVGKFSRLAMPLAAMAAAAFAQTPPPETLPPGTRVNQLPLSGAGTQPGSVVVTQTAVPGGQSVNTLNSTVRTQGAYQNSVPSAQTPGPPMAISLEDAIARGFKANLGSISYQQSVRLAAGQVKVDRSALLPQLSAGLTGVDQQINLAALGFPAFI